MSSEKIIKCDCCGRDISLSSKKWFVITKYFKFAIINVSFLNRWSDESELDICNDCYNQFKEWLRGADNGKT